MKRGFPAEGCSGVLSPSGRQERTLRCVRLCVKHGKQDCARENNIAVKAESKEKMMRNMHRKE